MLVLTFEDNEDAMMSRILSLINTREEVIQMSGMNNHLLSFKGLMIDEVQRVIIRENQEIELTYFFICKKHLQRQGQKGDRSTLQKSKRIRAVMISCP